MIKPLSDQVFAKVILEDNVSAAGIVLQSAENKTTLKCEVVAVGSGLVLPNGTIVQPSVEVGDDVLISKADAIPTKVDGVDYIVTRDSKILAIFD